MTVADGIQSIALFLAVGSFVLTIIVSRKQLKIFNKQLKLNFFADYTKRYQEIILNFPENINQHDFDYKNMSENDKNKVLRNMRVYFDLCSEEYDLYSTGYISERVWRNWEKRINFAFSKKAFIDVWNIVQNDTIYNDDFKNWINELINQEKEKSGGCEYSI